MKGKEKEKKKRSHTINTSAIAICAAMALLLFLTANTAALVVEKDIGSLSVDDFAALIRGEMISKQEIEKGRTEPAIMEVAHEVFNLSEMGGVITSEENATPENESKPITNESEANVTTSSLGWVIIKYETFEGPFPNTLWRVSSGRPPCRYTWDDDDYKPYAGSWSAWCADISLGGCRDLDPAYDNYPNNMDAWMIYGPFDLSDPRITDARMRFYHWTYTESRYDYFFYGASHDGVNFYGYRVSGDWRPWRSVTLSLRDYIGDSSVWVGFKFHSDSSVTRKGTFVDNVLIEKYHVPCTPVITSIIPSYGPAKAAYLGTSTPASDSTRVTIYGRCFGTTPGSVRFWRSGTTYYSAAIESWSDTRIVCRVPGQL